ncbi:MAG: KpsF/GutQ family sugar-phosphate isomerase [Alphaproteobacteria bacterium]
MTLLYLKKDEISFIGTAKEVIKSEADALYQLAECLDSSFEKVVTGILSIKGRIIVSGIGKSGQIGRKISATFASTGQPSFFIHPAEAAHGDLGMVTTDDAVLLISYSGESNELIPLINYCRRFKVPIFSITSRKNSTLFSLSNISLVLPNVKEACPMGLAPTSSTAMTLALGDALAVALLKSRSFTKQDFKILHPGGHIGKQLRFIKDYMHEDIPLAHEDTLMSDCIVTMTSYGFGTVGITQNNTKKLVGIITDGDLRRHMAPNLLNKKAFEVMTKVPHILKEQDLMADAIALFEKQSITCLFIVDDQSHVIGILHLHDCLRRHVL